MFKEECKTTRDMLIDIAYVLDDVQYTTTGNTVVIRLDDDRRIKVELHESWYKGHYDSIKMALVSKTRGCLDDALVKFEDIFESYEDETHPHRIEKYICKTSKLMTREEYFDWYGNPTGEDIEAINSEIVSYMLTWE